MKKRSIVIFLILGLISVIFAFSFSKHDVLAYSENHFYDNRLQFHSVDNNSDSNINYWLSFMGILSTIFAVFFVYTGFKIDNTKEKINDAEKRILKLEKKIQEEIYEYARQLEYCMSYIVQKYFDKAIDALTVLRSEPFVLKDDRKINTCCFFLAHCYYERGLLDKEPDKKKEDMAIAVEYINQAIEDSAHPFKIEIINAFKELDK